MKARPKASAEDKPYKLSLEDVRRVLKPDHTEIKLDPIINSILVPLRHEMKARVSAKENVARIITQAFSYMIRCETQYGSITTGEAFVFLHIKPENGMKTAYYHSKMNTPFQNGEVSLNPE